MNRPLLLDDSADLWFARQDRASASEMARAYELLDADERARAARFVVDPPRDLFVFAHGFLRRTLARYLDASPKALRFVAQSGGRPELEGDAPALRFNLSHTDGLVGCAVTRGAPCGFDVEGLNRDVSRERLLEMVLAAEEIGALKALAREEERRERFFEIWTLKEAYLKAQGLGITASLTKIAFAGFGGTIRVADAARKSDGVGWRFWSARRGARHRAAAAVFLEGGEADFRLFDADDIL